MANLERSQEWWARAERVIPMGTQTLSKSPTQFVQGVAPIYIQRGRGAHLWDVDGNEYIDYPMGLGPIILGYGDPGVDAAIRRQLEEGITFTLMHPLEVEVAERIVAMCPGVEAVRFAKSGSEAMSAAVRAARSHTRRDHVLVAGYHGWHDWFIGSTTRDAGVPERVASLVGTFHFNDLGSLRQAMAERAGLVAAVCLEPCAADVPEAGFLQEVIEEAHRGGALCIFDEVITGFRLAPGGARQRYGVVPDISCYGKALGNGMPISAVAGSWQVMRAFEEVFVSSTHGGETLSLAAAAAVLDAVADGRVLAEIAARGTLLMEGIARRITLHEAGSRVRIGGEPQRGVVTFPNDPGQVTRSWVQQCLMEAGVLFNGSMFICAEHSEEDLDRTLKAFDTALSVAGSTEDLLPLLKGPPVQPIFRAP